MPAPIGAASALASCLLASAALAEPLFPISVVSNDIDFIMASDPAVLGCLRYLGQATQGQLLSGRPTHGPH